MTSYTPIAESNNFIVLDKYTNFLQGNESLIRVYRNLLLSFPTSGVKDV